MEEKQTSPPALLETLRRLGATVLTIIQNRLQLLVVELQEERVRLFNALLLTTVVAVLGFFTLTAAAAALLILVWNEYGVRGLFIASAISLTSTTLAYWRLREWLKRWSLLTSTSTELKKDRECLEYKK